MKNYVAIYEDVVTEPEIPDGPGNEPQPLTYPIVYQNTMDASGVDALPTTYVEGEETGLVSLDKEGFVFMGWMANGTVIEGLNATLQDGLLQEDKIYISAVREPMMVLTQNSVVKFTTLYLTNYKLLTSGLKLMVKIKV